jgi:methionyl-tRNA formyltransferase
MKVFILTSSMRGTASYITEQVLKQNSNLIHGVIVCQGINSITPKKKIVRIIKKIFKIGFFGALNGIRIRSWFGSKTEEILKPQSFKEICENYSIPLFVVNNTNSDETQKVIKDNKIDLGVSLGNSYISSKIFNSFMKGMINIHGEILPEYQNGQSVIWQIYNQSINTGYTIHKINSKIDKGDILLKKEINIIFRKKLAETVSETCSKITMEAADGLIELLSNYENYIPLKQGIGNKYTTPSLFQFCKILYNHNKLALQYYTEFKIIEK